MVLLVTVTSGCANNLPRTSSNSSDTNRKAISAKAEYTAGEPQDAEPPTPTSNRPGSSNRIYSSSDQLPAPISSNTATRIYSEAPTNPSSPAASEPIDQGGAPMPQDRVASEADRELAVQIRKNMINDTSMAAAAPSIKVTVNNGKVMLSGEVKSKTEKENLGILAQRTERVASVDNQLEVKAGHP